MWTQDIAGARVENSIDHYSTWIPFVGDSELGYLSPEGTLLYREDLQFNAAIRDGAHVNYSGAGVSEGLHMPGEGILFEIDAEGFPFFRSGSLYLLSRDRMSLVSLDERGNERFRFDFSSLITSVEAGGNWIVVGLLNGKAELYSKEGERKATLKPQEGNRPIYGLAVSPSGEKVSLLWGDRPQHLSLYRITRERIAEGEAPVESGRITREEPVLSEALMRFSRDEELLFYETTEGCAIVDLTDMSEKDIPLSGSVFDIASVGRESYVYIMENRGQKGFFHVYNRTGVSITVESIPERITYFYPHGDGAVYTAGGTSVFIEGGRM